MSASESIAPAIDWFETREAYVADQETRGEEHIARRAVENALEIVACGDGIEFHCDLHGGLATFRCEPGHRVDWREEVLCGTCRLNARMRCCLALMLAHTPAERALRVYLTEQASFGYVAARRLWPGAEGSEYCPDPERQAALGIYVRNICSDGSLRLRHEDATRLGLATAAFDLLGSFDVLEHIPDHCAALREFARVLAPGGTLVLTAPFLADRQPTLTRARLRADGTIEHLEAPEYHGDPVAPEGGVLCFHHFGWDLLHDLRAAGFSQARVARAWSPARGIIGAQLAFVAMR